MIVITHDTVCLAWNYTTFGRGGGKTEIRFFRRGINFSCCFRGWFGVGGKKGERRRRCCHAVELFMSLTECLPRKSGRRKLDFGLVCAVRGKNSRKLLVRLLLSQFKAPHYERISVFLFLTLKSKNSLDFPSKPKIPVATSLTISPLISSQLHCLLWAGCLGSLSCCIIGLEATLYALFYISLRRRKKNRTREAKAQKANG